MKTLSIGLLLFYFLLQISTVSAQSEAREAVQEILGRMNKSAETNAMEKIYLHMDKPYYAPGDTLWLKTYLFDAGYLSPAKKSGIVYVEIADDRNQVVKRIMISIFMGLGIGNIPLIRDDFQQGAYTIRAYSNWMRNFDEHYIFKKQFYIGSPDAQDLLINSKIAASPAVGKARAVIDLQLKTIDLQPLASTDLQLKVTEGTKVWYKDNLKTSVNGSVDFNFSIPEKANANQLTLSVQPLKNNAHTAEYRIPILYNGDDLVDLQFLPESGSLIGGIDSKVAFKAITENGKGKPVSGEIFNSKQEVVASFVSNQLGIGKVNLHTQVGEIYTAKIKFSNGTYSKSYPLPAVKPSGLVLSVTNGFNKDSLDVTVNLSPDLLSINKIYFLIGQSNGIPNYGAVFKMSKPQYTTKVSKSVFPTGVSRLTLLNSTRQVVSERIVFIDHNDYLRVKLTPNKQSYTKRDSVGFDIVVTDKSGAPVSGSFSIAVTDDAQVKSDSLDRSLKSDIFLTSNLKSKVESPGYYFPAVTTEKVWTDLDNLLLVQGWVNYDWDSIFGTQKPMQISAEKSFSINGRVLNFFNKPVNNSKVILLSKKPSFVRDTVTNQEGKFNFTRIFPIDTAVYLIQSRNKNGKSFNVGIEINEFKPPLLNPIKDRIIPWYLNIDSGQMNMVSKTITYHNEYEKVVNPNMLKEVKIKGIKFIRDSKNLNEDGGSDFALNEQELQKAGKTTLGDLLWKNIKGFSLGYGKQRNLYFIYSQRVHLIIDGVDIDFSKPEGGIEEYKEYFQYFLDYYTAEDIKGIEVMNSAKYVSNYAQAFMNPMAELAYNSFIEVTTYGGQGPYLKKTTGVFLYKPMVFSSNVQFYSPKYNMKNNDGGFDIRSTIYWAPNIVTDKNGKGTFSFYTADKPGAYTLKLEGSNMSGGIGSMEQKLWVR
ncbi:MAG: hypothetical protein P0Y49_02555 [Candidatus Pedobacter colombiensis]|uniref:Carboxypeptidase regulatory-like domain-containing protein n=1 Tax=Candidatus Pedobacter colombiensis TaxID=3121371 RepID=A0AAJ5W7L2_9SPHI|nr:hypothetical protein [Pedobacter sp.]WEK20033.1 MAG: hypothetical protein P0Y49_02555 [Pedobacter sp.]